MPSSENAGQLLKLRTMANHRGGMAMALCGAAAAVAIAVGYGADNITRGPTIAGSSSAAVTPAPAPTPKDPGGAFPAVPVGGGGCYIGLNCGCIPRITCPTPHRHPPAAVPGRDAPGGQNP